MGATADDLARARGVTAQGATAFANACASCHGERGEGLGGVSAVLGTGALPEYSRRTGAFGELTPADPELVRVRVRARPRGTPWRDPIRNAQDLHGFVAGHLLPPEGQQTSPPPRAARLDDGDDWAVVSFLLAAQGASLPAGGVGPANAASIPIPQR